ncbi:MAG: hypothetical protein IT368_06505 [Candidatus Hydrogenedentes bacterium]|nr:hypothetical protein [Candidatus Hydrogenedentota bacterium]
MRRTAKELLNRYYVHPTPGTWRHLLAERPEVTCLGQMGEGAVLLEVRGYPGGQQRRERAIVTLGEAFADGLRLVDIAEGKIILEYLPLMQEFEVPAPSN